ncbi:MAG TPA: cation diffusion facilitator family transporter, partial [Planctomycetaceae bacterium]|nr:cation diffusion facilitator family transporter [Planctomycetaceae bacterium]
MSHDHSHHGHHHHGPANYNRAFAIGVALNVTYVIIEAGAGMWIGSLALLADAAHNLTDVLGLLIAWGAAYLSGTKPTAQRTYGLRSSSVLGAVANGLILLVAVGGIMWEAILRFWTPEPVPGMAMICVAAVGVLINGITTALFVSGREHDLNIRGAFLHMAADTAVSLGVVIAGVVILQTGWEWIDPTVSLVVAAVVLWSTWDLLKESVHLALQGVPAGIDFNAVQEYLQQLPGVTEVHDLHIWGMSTTESALTVHLIKPQIENEDELLAQIVRALHDRFSIEHVTIQIERSNE